MAVDGCARATTRGLQLPPDLAFDEWLHAGKNVSRIASASAWWLGDWLLYGERAYGSRYRAALELLPLDYKTLRNYAWVAGRFELSRRRDNLSFQHHAEVASLAEPAQELWLHRAGSGAWSRNELRRQLTAAQVGSRAAEDGGSIVVRVDVTDQRAERWRDAALAAGQELADWITAAADQAADVVLELAPATVDAADTRLLPPSST